MKNPFEFADETGFEKIVYLHRPDVGLRAIVVIHNTACGPSIGGVRMAPDVSLEECFRLARAMTFKNAAAGLAAGGGKSVIFADPSMPRDDKERLIRAFAKGIEDLTGYIPGPDMGTNEVCMAWVHDEIGRAVGLPTEIGGIPLDEIGATAWGLRVSVVEACKAKGQSVEGQRVAIQGFGAVGLHTARFLADLGARIVAVGDSRGAVHAPDGLAVDALVAHKRAGNSVGTFEVGTAITSADLVAVDCDIWIPAARPDAIHEDNVDHVKAKLIVPGANIGVTEAAEAALHARGVTVLPDFITNAGGVICAFVEYQGGTSTQAFGMIEEKIAVNVREVLSRTTRDVTPRAAAEEMARRRLDRAMSLRRAF